MSDEMFIDLLRMPPPAVPDASTVHTLADRARRAADRIEADAALINRLRAEIELLKFLFASRS